MGRFQFEDGAVVVAAIADDQMAVGRQVEVADEAGGRMIQRQHADEATVVVEQLRREQVPSRRALK